MPSRSTIVAGSILLTETVGCGRGAQRRHSQVDDQRPLYTVAEAAEVLTADFGVVDPRRMSVQIQFGPMVYSTTRTGMARMGQYQRNTLCTPSRGCGWPDKARDHGPLTL